VKRFTTPTDNPNKAQAPSNNNAELIERQPQGVFEFLINKCAFFDKVVLGVWGTKRATPQPSVYIERNLPIAGAGRMYGRSDRGYAGFTPNAFELKYGRLLHYENVPPFRLTLRSDVLPISCAQVLLVADGLLWRGFRSYISSVELTFDIAGFQIPSLVCGLWSTARTQASFTDRSGRRTFYLGTPRSRWQMRIYQKSEQIVRVEYVFRLPLLRATRIKLPQDLIRLRRIRLGRFARFESPIVQTLLRKMARQAIW
jgi:hypothetical protein